MPSSSYLSHHLLLKDEERTESYRRAVRAAVRPSDVVCDLGTGTGILAIEAARSGARKVYAIELDPAMARISRQVITENGYSDAITVIEGASQEVELPEKVDVLTSDVTGFFGISEEMEAFFQARDRWLKPGGRLVPNLIDLLIAPVEVPDVFAHLEISTAYGLSLQCLRSLSLSQVYVAEIQPENLLAPAQTIAKLNMFSANSCLIDASVCWSLERSGVLHGFGGWFEAELGGGVRLTNSPETSRLMGKKRLFPLWEEVPVTNDDEIHLKLNMSPTLYFWRTETVRSGELHARFNQSTLAANPRWSETFPGSMPAEAPGLLIRASRDPVFAETLRAKTNGDFDWAAALGIVAEESASLSQGRFTGPRPAFR
jgi:hypothetical protein